jgi:methylated-DNA-[protein]-cysteine S-methyltransferase
MHLFHTIDSPIGELLLTGNGSALTGLHMEPFEVRPDWRRGPATFAAAEEQLRAYFAGELRDFDLPLAPRGTEFQLRVWDALRAIPYGETASYQEVAAMVGKPHASRAVGAANGRNPIAVIVPCHRVIGADGTLTGYGGGLARKRVLLELERGVGAMRLDAGFAKWR